MSRTWYGHHIETIKGDDYVLFKDYLELDKEIDKLNNIIERLGSIFRSMQFSAPENMYVHLDRMANVFQEWLSE